MDKYVVKCGITGVTIREFAGYNKLLARAGAERLIAKGVAAIVYGVRWSHNEKMAYTGAKVEEIVFSPWDYAKSREIKPRFYKTMRFRAYNPETDWI